MFPWAVFLISAVVAYIGIAIFAQLTGGSSISPWQAFFSTLRPLPLLITTIANMIFGLALFYGFSLTRYAIPIAIAMGAMTSFIYSIVILGAQVTVVKIAGIALIVGGIVLLGM